MPLSLWSYFERDEFSCFPREEIRINSNVMDQQDISSTSTTVSKMTISSLVWYPLPGRVGVLASSSNPCCRSNRDSQKDLQQMGVFAKRLTLLLWAEWQSQTTVAAFPRLVPEFFMMPVTQISINSRRHLADRSSWEWRHFFRAISPHTFPRS